MKLSISNLAWNLEDSEKVFEYLKKKHFDGIEIAPSKIYPKSTYSHIDEAVEFFSKLKTDYGLEVSSMQSIWYGQNANIFHSRAERQSLQKLTFLAIDFASAIGCNNLVFGNPKARNMDGNHTENEVFGFFRNISEYAFLKRTYIALEPNPIIYNTNFINNTKQAFEFCRYSGCECLRVNVDLGTIIYNDEPFDWVEDNISLVNHIHISEPYLKKIEKRELHKKLQNLDYNKYVSIEMGLQKNIKDVFEVIDYVGGIFR